MGQRHPPCRGILSAAIQPLHSRRRAPGQPGTRWVRPCDPQPSGAVPATEVSPGVFLSYTGKLALLPCCVPTEPCQCWHRCILCPEGNNHSLHTAFPDHNRNSEGFATSSCTSLPLLRFPLVCHWCWASLPLGWPCLYVKCAQLKWL